MDGQVSLFYEDWLEALRELVRVLGGAKQVGHQLRPEVPIGQAHTWLLNCLDRNRPEKLDPEQVVLLLRLARQQGHHQAFWWLCEELGYARAQPIEPEDERAELEREFVRSVELQRQLLDRLERLVGKGVRGRETR